jgi:hypothetical protein
LSWFFRVAGCCAAPPASCTALSTPSTALCVCCVFATTTALLLGACIDLFGSACIVCLFPAAAENGPCALSVVYAASLQACCGHIYSTCLDCVSVFGQGLLQCTRFLAAFCCSWGSHTSVVHCYYASALCVWWGAQKQKPPPTDTGTVATAACTVSLGGPQGLFGRGIKKRTARATAYVCCRLCPCGGDTTTDAGSLLTQRR